MTVCIATYVSSRWTIFLHFRKPTGVSRERNLSNRGSPTIHNVSSWGYETVIIKGSTDFSVRAFSAN